MADKIKFGPIAVAQALTPRFGEKIAMRAALTTPLHSSPEWKTLEFHVAEAEKRALAEIEERADHLNRRKDVIEDELRRLDDELANLEQVLSHDKESGVSSLFEKLT